MPGKGLQAGLFSAFVSPRRNPAGQITRTGRTGAVVIGPGWPSRQWARYESKAMTRRDSLASTILGIASIS
jgi:hypothetical protein